MEGDRFRWVGMCRSRGWGIVSSRPLVEPSPPSSRELLGCASQAGGTDSSRVVQLNNNLRKAGTTRR